MVTEGSKKLTLYFIKHDILDHDTPDVAVHQGGTDSGPVIASSHFDSIFAKKVQFGFGESSASSPTWEEMRRDRDADGKKQWRFGLSFSEGRHEFVWQHTRDVGKHAMHHSAQNLRLVDEAGSVLAVFENCGLKSWKHKGRLILLGHTAGCDLASWESIVLVTVMTLLERLRRIAFCTHGLVGL